MAYGPGGKHGVLPADKHAPGLPGRTRAPHPPSDRPAPQAGRRAAYGSVERAARRAKGRGQRKAARRMRGMRY